MKSLLILLTLASFSAHAKISGFNSMISDIQQSQKESHAEYLKSIGEKDTQDKNIQVVLEEKTQPENITTKKNLLAFTKERKSIKKPVKKIQERLAQELKDIE